MEKAGFVFGEVTLVVSAIPRFAMGHYSFRLFNSKLVSNLLSTFYISGRNQWRAKLLAFEQPDEADQRQTMRKTAFQGSLEKRSEGVTLSSQFFSALVVLYNDFIFIYDM